ncbi:MAG: carbohydrate-binding domain-containing protein [Lautropia sp.]|nr:carbohydrate-binding domain-containing protein [Lautropia sp.]
MIHSSCIHADDMQRLQYLLLTSLIMSGLAACGGSDHAADPSRSSGAPTSSGSAAAGNTGVTTPTNNGQPNEAATLDRGWDIATGAHAPDRQTLDEAIPLSIALDTLAVNSPSPRLSIQTTSPSVRTVTLDGQPALTITRDANGLTLNSTVTGAARLAYRFSGTGTTPVTLFSQTDYKLVLDNAALNSPDGPALNLPSTSTAFIELQGTSTLSDTTQWRARTGPDGKALDMKATLFAEGPLVFRGTGSLSIDAKGRHALASDSHLRLSSGKLTLKAAARDGIRAGHAFIMDGGTLDIEAQAGKGIKVDGEENANQPALGFVTINGGALSIKSHDKAMTASWEAEDDAKTPTLADDPDPRITINGGTLKIQTTGPVRNDSDDPKDPDAPSPEGIEAKSVLSIKGGELQLDTMDDAFNAGTHFEMTDGRVHAHSRHNDAIDSNGTIAIRGGILVATSQGPEPEGAIDSDGSDFIVTGGTFVGLGYYNSTPTAGQSTQNIIQITQGRQDAVSPGLWALRDASGQLAFAFQVPFAAHYMTLSSPKIATGSTYSLVTGGTLDASAPSFHGLSTDPGNHTGGNVELSFTVQERLTSLGQPFEWSPAGP